MKTTLALFTFLAAFVFSAPVDALTIERMGAEALFAIPHNERVVRSQLGTVVARYEARGDIRVRVHPHLYLAGELEALGVQRWAKNHSNGLAAWGATDWRVSAIAPKWQVRLGIPITHGWQVVTDYGRCMWCATPDGRYFARAGVRWDFR